MSASPDSDAGKVTILARREAGEEEVIRRRSEWFFASRRPGSGGEMRLRRRDAVEELRAAVRMQAERKPGGAEGGRFWSPRGPASSLFGGWTFGRVSGRIIALAKDWDRGILYAGGASGGLWRSEDDGVSWTSLLDGAGTTTVGVIALDPQDPGIIWVGTGENSSWCESYFGIGLLRSTDGGETWEARNGTGTHSLEHLSAFASVCIDPRDSDRLVVGGRYRDCVNGNYRWGGLYTSTDGGGTWETRLSGLGVTEIVRSPHDPDILWAGVSHDGQGGVYRSEDNGETWVLQGQDLPEGDMGRIEVALSPADPDTVFALFADAGGRSEFWRSTNGGDGWSRMSLGSDACDGQCWYNMVIRGHLTDPETIYRGTIHIFRSTDGGAHWTDLSNGWGPSQVVHQDTHAFLMHPADPNTFYVGCDGGIWKTTDGGATFRNLNGNLCMTQFYAVGIHPTDDGIILGGTQDNSSLVRVGSDQWALQLVTGDGFVCHFSSENPERVYTAGYPYDLGEGTVPLVYRSDTGIFGDYHFITDRMNGIQPGDRCDWVTPYILDPGSPDTVFLGTHRVYRSLDGGDHWDQVGPSDMTDGGSWDNLVSLEVNRSDGRFVFAGTTDGRAWKSADGGDSWTDASQGLPDRSINDIAGDPDHPESALCVVGGFGTPRCFRYSGTGSWSLTGAGLPNVPANTVILVDSQEVYVGTDVGVYRSLDGGSSFEPFMNGLPLGVVVTDLKFNPVTRVLTAGTYGRGVWQIALTEGGPDVEFAGDPPLFLEVEGDGDGNVEPGETWSVSPSLRNVGSETAPGVSAALSSADPLLTVLEPSSRNYGDLGPGSAVGPQEPFLFLVDRAAPCGERFSLDLVDVSSGGLRGAHPDVEGFWEVRVVGEMGEPTAEVLLEDDFDPAPGAGWSHQVIDPQLDGCGVVQYVDEWHTVVKEPGRGSSYHCGDGPGGEYARSNAAWLLFGGWDSQGGEGLPIPADAAAARMTLSHWYDTDPSQDGGVVLIDDGSDGVDAYEVLRPEEGYAGVIRGDSCNAAQHLESFTGYGGAFRDASFDLTPYVGRTVHLAFLFGSDTWWNAGEGWYVDDVLVEVLRDGVPTCDVFESCVLTCAAQSDPVEGHVPLEVAFTSTVEAVDCEEAPSHHWDFGDGETSAEAHPNHVYEQQGLWNWALTVAADGRSCRAEGIVVAGEAPSMPGDCDGGGSISLGEVQAAINMFLGVFEPACAVDADGDGSVSVGEVQAVINLFLL